MLQSNFDIWGVVFKLFQNWKWLSNSWFNVSLVFRLFMRDFSWTYVSSSSALPNLAKSRRHLFYEWIVLTETLNSRKFNYRILNLLLVTQRLTLTNHWLLKFIGLLPAPSIANMKSLAVKLDFKTVLLLLQQIVKFNYLLIMKRSILYKGSG